MARVTCPNYEAKATITSRETQSAHVVNLYCSRTNTNEYGATCRITQSFDLFLNPPFKTIAQLAASLIKNLPREEQLELIGL